MRTPDGQERIISLTAGHWDAMEYMIRIEHRTLDDLMDTAFGVYSRNRHPEAPFSTYFGVTIQEAYVQLEYEVLGFTNDNAD